MDYKLLDLVERPLLRQMLDQLYEATSLSATIVDQDGADVAGTPAQDICTLLHGSEAALALCHQSDAVFGDHFAHSSEDIIVTCPHGLVDSATSILVDGRCIGRLITGQLFLAPPDKEEFRARARRFGLDEDEFLAALRRVPVISRGELNRHLAVIRTFTGMLGELGRKRLDELRALEELKRGNNLLERASRYNRSLIEANGDAMAVVGADGRIADVNAAAERLTGLGRGELLGTSADVFYSSQTVARAVLGRAFRDGRLSDVETEIRRRDGHATPVLLNVTAFNGETGRAQGLLLTARDLTQRKKHEEQISRAQQYKLLADNSTDVILRMTPEGVCTYISPSCKRVLGYTPEDVMGCNMTELFHPEDMPEYLAARRSIRAAGRHTFLFAARFRLKDGSYLWTEASGQVFFGAQNQPAEVQVALRDISERKRAEKELKAYKERLDIVLKNADAVICQLDREGTITLAEGRGLDAMGVRQEQLIGNHSAELLKGNPMLATALRQVMAGRRATAEFTVGSVVFDSIFTPYMGADGVQDGAICLAVDITERKRAEQNLHAEKERLRVMLQSIGDGVIAADSDGRVVLMNGVAEQMTGWRAAEAVGRPFAEVFDIHDEITGNPVANPVERVLQTGSSVGPANHTVLHSAEGRVRSVALSAAPILDSSRKVQGVILVFRDVAEAKRKEIEITYLSYHDMLTGLYNRTFFEEEIRRLDTERQLPISVIMGDVNGLKLTNDVFGHAEGDKLLTRISAILRECCRNEDIVARVGGDEFCILLPKTGYAATSDICKRIYMHCEQVEFGLPKGGAKLSISLGFATKSGNQETIANIMKAAEDLMYRRKLLESRSQHSFLISSIRTTLFEKSFETEQHAQRLIANSRAIAMALNLPDDQINDIELFALLHDIGKIAVDSRILTKQGPLDETEWTEMRRHPEIGFRIAQASPDLAHIAECILCHHERWDGSGYPQGLKGTAIPLLARILLVVDAYDAMTQDRVYRKAMSREDACTELLMHAGTQFDPNIVWAFMEWLENSYYPAG